MKSTASLPTSCCVLPGLLLLAVVLLLPCRSAAQGSSFQTQLANDRIYALAEQPDGKVLVGGNFTQIAGTPQQRLARFHANGTLDTSFNPGANDEVNCLAVQDDGKIIVGGRFTFIAGQRRIAIARLNGDGTLDPSLLANADERVKAIAIQQDGKIVIAGAFFNVGSSTRNHIARLLPAGQLDTTYNPNLNDTVETMALDAQGRILIGGGFTVVGGVVRRGAARLLPNGTLDSNFTWTGAKEVSAAFALPEDKVLMHNNTGSAAVLSRLLGGGAADVGFNAPRNFLPYSLVAQTDGVVIAGGNFWASETDYTKVPDNMARLQSSGTRDAAFTGPVNELVTALAIRSDGSILLADLADYFGTDSRLMMLPNSATSQSLTVTGGNLVRWLRTGSQPEVEAVIFQTSPDGTTWTHLGFGTRITGGWELANASPPATGQLRALGRTRCGENNGSLGLIQTLTTLGSSGLTYDAWAAATLPAGARAQTDRNGPLNIQNLLAYVLGINPLTATPTSLPALARDPADPGRLKFTYTRSKNATGITWEMQSSTTLASWGPASLSSHAKVSEDAARETWQAGISATPGGRIFLRLKATLAP